MAKHRLDDACQKIVQHIAETGKPRAKAIKHLWKQLALEPWLVEQFARQFLDGGWRFGAYEDAGSFACVSQALSMELCKYEYQGNCKVLDDAEVKKVLSVMVPLFGKPKYRHEDEPKGRRITWPARTDERALRMCTLIHSLGIQPLRSRHLVSIYGPLTEKMKIHDVERKLDGE
jgi:hypothetical protein